jgi:hypothetical protein
MTLTSQGWGSVLDVAGPIRQCAAVPFMEAVAADLLAVHHRAVVYDYRAADMELSAAQLAGAARRGAAAIVRVPSAIVVNEAALAYWRQYAYLQGKLGFMRSVFLDRAAAVRWAADQAELLEKQAKWFALARSPQ